MWRWAQYLLRRNVMHNGRCTMLYRHQHIGTGHLSDSGNLMKRNMKTLIILACWPSSAFVVILWFPLLSVSEEMFFALCKTFSQSTSVELVPVSFTMYPWEHLLMKNFQIILRLFVLFFPSENKILRQQFFFLKYIFAKT